MSSSPPGDAPPDVSPPESESQDGRAGRTPAMIFIFATLLIDVLGIGLVVPVLPELVKDFTGGDVTAAGRWYGVLAAVYALMQFLFAPVLGALSDRFGRRSVLLISLFGLGVDYVVMGLAPSLWWLFAARVFSGIMGASITTGNAYIADISTPENRARNFGLVGVAFGVGFIFGPALGGLLGSIHLRLPFFVAAGLALVNWLYGFFVLPESLPRHHRSAFSWRKANPVGSLRILRSYPMVGGLAAAFVLMSLAQRGLESTWVLYTGYRYGWDERSNGLALALVGVMAVIVQGFLVKPVVSRIGERKSVLFGLFWGSLAYAGYGLSVNGAMILTTIVFGAFAGVAGPSIQALVSGTVSPSDQGKVQGALTSLMSLSSIVAPLVFASGLFSFFTSDAAPFELPGAPFLLGSVCFFSAGVVVLRLFRRMPV